MLAHGTERRRLRVGVLVAVVACASCSSEPTSDTADTAPATTTVTATTVVEWPAVLDGVLREMTQRLDPLTAACDHNALFAATYLLTTRTVRAAAVAGEFDSPEFISHFAEAFAARYFDSRDAWISGNISDIPEAWVVAYEASDDRRVSSVGDLLLGMNAHISRDLAFVVADTIPVEDDSRERDFLHFNDLVARAGPEILETLRTVYDPTITALVPFGLFGGSSFEALITTWRAESYANGRLMASAATAADREIVAARVEEIAAQRAQLIRLATNYLPVIGDVSGRDDRCGS